MTVAYLPEKLLRAICQVMQCKKHDSHPSISTRNKMGPRKRYAAFPLSIMIVTQFTSKVVNFFSVTRITVSRNKVHAEKWEVDALARFIIKRKKVVPHVQLRVCGMPEVFHRYAMFKFDRCNLTRANVVKGLVRLNGFTCMVLSLMKPTGITTPLLCSAGIL